MSGAPLVGCIGERFIPKVASMALHYFFDFWRS